MRNLLQTLFFFLLVTQICFAQWEWQYPLPQGNTLNDVFFTDDNNGTAVGDIGTIIRTTNGGIDWIVQESGTELNLKGVNFINNDIGYIVGANRILRTTNGGTTWTSQLIDSVALNDICFTDLNNGWAVGSNGKIWKTTDGGITWNQQSNPAPNNANLIDVCFIDSNIGWVVGVVGIEAPYTIILKTEDSGMTWVEQNIVWPHPLTILGDACFSDVNKGWISGWSMIYINGFWVERGIIFKTTDGGMTWSYQFLTESQRLNSICFANQDLGWAVGDIIFRTTNSGITWEQQSSNNASEMNDVFVLNTNEAWIVGKGGTIRKTTDSGANWMNINGEQADLKDVVFLDLMNGWAVGGGGTVLKTTNGGSSWNLQSTAGTLTLSAVYFCDENNGWVVSDGDYSDTSKIFHTTDGGTTWTSQINIPSSFLFDIFFLDDNTGFAVGGSAGPLFSIFLSTIDGGFSWNADYDTLFPIRRIQFINEDIGYILSALEGWQSRFIIYKTEDGGETWETKLETDSWPGLYDMYFWDADNGIAVGRAVFRTTDGGETWTDTLALYSIYSPEIYVYINQVTAVGRGGLIYQSTDFGRTWNSQTSGTEWELEGVFFVDALNGWVVGDNGTIIHTTNGGVSFVEEEKINELPTQFLLSQNYPNPFNPSTKIKYSIPSSSQVTIKVFDVLGNEIETLVNEEKPTGTYELTWNAANLPSGVYFYQLRAGEFVQTKKMLLLK